MILSGKNVVVYGGGLSGLAAQQLVRDLGARAILFDDDASVSGATDNVRVFEKADMIILSPGVDKNRDFLLDAKLSGTTVIGELELASSVCRAKQIAITGTNGKTSTTMLIKHILDCAGKSAVAVGNIGAPFCAVADKLDALETAVIEASSFQLESAINFSPDVAVMLNISPDHLERHKSMEKYISAKANIFAKLTECDVAVYNADDEKAVELAEGCQAKKVPFSMTRPVCGAYLSSGFVCYKGSPVVELCETPFCGKETENLLAATAVCMCEGVSRYTVASAATSFKKPRYRRERAGSIDGINLINDSKATNIASALSALEGAESGCVMIMGGCLREEDFGYFFAQADKTKLKAVSAYGENSSEIAARAKENEVRTECAESIDAALDNALKLAKEADVREILFSPASKSFDMFSGFEERGRAFAAAARARGAKDCVNG